MGFEIAFLSVESTYNLFLCWKHSKVSFEYRRTQKDEFYDDIKNGTHPYDRTVRPQILEKEMKWLQELKGVLQNYIPREKL